MVTMIFKEWKEVIDFIERVDNFNEPEEINIAPYWDNGNLCYSVEVKKE